MPWLKQPGAAINVDWVKRKIDDYRIDGYLGKLDAMWQRLPGIIRGTAFKNEMARFIPI